MRNVSPFPKFTGQKLLERDGRRRTPEQHEPGAVPPAHGALRPQHDPLRAEGEHRVPRLPRAAGGQVAGVVLRARRAALLVRHGDVGGVAQEVEERQGQDAAEVAASGTCEIGKMCNVLICLVGKINAIFNDVSATIAETTFHWT